jgi:hypothetical protein
MNLYHYFIQGDKKDEWTIATPQEKEAIDKYYSQDKKSICNVFNIYEKYNTLYINNKQQTTTRRINHIILPEHNGADEINQETVINYIKNDVLYITVMEKVRKLKLEKELEFERRVKFVNRKKDI